jgi:hypothetical protein
VNLDDVSLISKLKSIKWITFNGAVVDDDIADVILNIPSKFHLILRDSSVASDHSLAKISKSTNILSIQIVYSRSDSK